MVRSRAYTINVILVSISPQSLPNQNFGKLWKGRMNWGGGETSLGGRYKINQQTTAGPLVCLHTLTPLSSVLCTHTATLHVWLKIVTGLICRHRNLWWLILVVKPVGSGDNQEMDFWEDLWRLLQKGSTQREDPHPEWAMRWSRYKEIRKESDVACLSAFTLS